MMQFCDARPCSKKRIRSCIDNISTSAHAPWAIVMSEIDANYYEVHRRRGWYGVFLVDLDGNLHDIGVWFCGGHDAVIQQLTDWARSMVFGAKVIVYKLPRKKRGNNGCG